MPKYPHNGMNRREIDSIIIALGGTIDYPRRTGDALYRHPSVPHPVRVNNRRKDSTRALVALARAAYDAVHGDDQQREDGPWTGQEPEGMVAAQDRGQQ
jgi:hypothetical protein